MGGCSSSDDAELPSKITLNSQLSKFKTIEQKVFEIPAELNSLFEVHTSNGKVFTT
jgi:hypothetical protein